MSGIAEVRPTKASLQSITKDHPSLNVCACDLLTLRTKSEAEAAVVIVVTVVTVAAVVLFIVYILLSNCKTINITRNLKKKHLKPQIMNF